MPSYSPTKVDLFYPARRGNFFDNIPQDNLGAVSAEMSRLAYCRKEPAFGFDRDRISAELNGRQFPEVQFFESKGTPDGMGTHCFLASDPTRRVAIIAFRGTDSSDPTDLFDDAFAPEIRWGPGGRVHAGFVHALSHVQDDLLAAIVKLDGYETFCTGHSLGAAMATLTASLLAGRKPPIALCTIGSPRVGDQGFVDTLKEVKAFRYVDCCDIVTHLPPEKLSWTDPYTHFGEPYYIDRVGALHVSPGDDFVSADRRSAAAEYLWKYTCTSGNVAVRELADHAPINYVEALK